MTSPIDTMKLADRGREVLRNAGLRVTPQREAVLDLFAIGDGHWTPQRIFGSLEHGDLSLSLATVYNTLETFEAVGLVRRFTTPEGQTVFDRNTAAHQHAVCAECGGIHDIVMSPCTLQVLIDEASSNLEFEAFAANVWIRGVCTECR